MDLGLTKEELAEVEAAFSPSSYTGELLLALARAKSDYDRSGRGALSVFSAATNVIADALGEPLLASVYGQDPPNAAPDAEHLRKLAERLFAVSLIFAGSNPKAKSSLESASDELRAIAAGDAPRIFRSMDAVKGRPINAYRIAFHQLRALAWEVFLKAQGNSPSDTHGAIHNAFGAEWTTISRWKAPVIRELGQQHYDRAMRDAARGFSPELGLIRNTDQAIARLERHGQEYQAELKRRVVVA